MGQLECPIGHRGAAPGLCPAGPERLLKQLGELIGEDETAWDSALGAVRVVVLVIDVRQESGVCLLVQVDRSTFGHRLGVPAAFVIVRVENLLSDERVY